MKIDEETIMDELMWTNEDFSDKEMSA